MCIQKCHNETSCIIIINWQKCFSLINEGQEGKTDPDGYQSEKGGQKERVKEGEYGGNILYSCMKIEHWNLLKLF
jgi:hypothetical protein